MKKSTVFFAVLVVSAAAISAEHSPAQAETITGKVVAITKSSKDTSAEIIPDSPGGPSPHRCSVTTTFNEIGEMLMQAMESKVKVTIVSSDNCAMTGAVRNCGSVVTLETVQHGPSPQPHE